jgi:DNA gyrase subunit A
MHLSEQTGRIVAARVVTKKDEVTCISTHGIILRTSVENVSRQGRYSRGVSVMDLRDGDTIASVAVIREGYLSRVNDEDTAGASLSPAEAESKAPGADGQVAAGESDGSSPS